MKTLVLIFLFSTQIRLHPKTFAESPVANAEVSYGILITTAGGLLVTLDGSKSHDPDGYITRYKWTQVGIFPNIVHITRSSESVTTVTPSSWVAGVYTFQLKVTDNMGGSGKATVKVTVVDSVL
jgi:hypothetical protein